MAWEMSCRCGELSSPKPADSAAAWPGAHCCNRSNKSITANNATNHNIARLAHTTIFHGP